MKVIKGNFGKVILCDNMDKDYGLPSLKDQSFDLCITDYPFNLQISSGVTFNSDKTFYRDSVDFEVNTRVWLSEMMRVGKGTAVYGLKRHLEYFYTYHPRDIFFVVKQNCQSGGSVSNLQRCNFVLFWGEFNGKLPEDYFITYSMNGFLREKMYRVGEKYTTTKPKVLGAIKENKYTHPCPLPYDVWEYIISNLQPKSVLDPFMGSGTTAEVCESLGIQYLGYELNVDNEGNRANYDKDINLRINEAKKRYIERQKQLKQQSILDF